MAIEPYIAPLGGLRYDLPADLIASTDMSDCRNVFFEDGLIKKRYGYKQMGSNLPLSGAVMGFDQFYDFQGNDWLICVTENQIYKWLPATSKWDSMGDGSGSYGEGLYGAGAYGAQADSFTGDDEDYFSYDYVRKSTETDPWWIMTNGVDPIKKFTGTGTISDLISDFPTGVTSLLAKHYVEFKTYGILMDVTENGNRYPQRVRWPDTADPEDYVNGNASYQDLSGADWIMGGIVFKGDYIAVFKERSIWIGYATGDRDVFQFDLKVSGAGCAAGKTIESLGDEIIFLGWDDVYVFNGIDYEPIGTPIQREIFEVMNPQEINRCFGVIIEEQKEYWLFVPSTGQTYPDMAWCFNYSNNKWTRHDFADTMTMFGYYELQSTTTFDDLSGTFDAQTWRFDDRTVLAAMPTTLFGDSGGYVYEYDRSTNNDDATAIDGWFSTKDFNPTQLQQRFLVNNIDVYGTWNNLTVSYSIDKGSSWTDLATLTLNTDATKANRIYCKVDSRQMRLRFRNNSSGEHFEFSRANIMWRPTGGRL